MPNLSLKIEQISDLVLANLLSGAILSSIGCGSLMQTAAVVSVKGGNSGNIFFEQIFESVGRCICTGVTVCTSSTPAGSFFVPDVEVRGKSLTKKTLQTGGSTWTAQLCSHTVTARNTSRHDQSFTIFPFLCKSVSKLIRLGQSHLPLSASQTKKHSSTMLTPCQSRKNCAGKSGLFLSLNTISITAEPVIKEAQDAA